MIVRSLIDNFCYVTLMRTFYFLLHLTIWMRTLVVTSWVVAALDLLLAIFSPVISIFRWCATDASSHCVSIASLISLFTCLLIKLCRTFQATFVLSLNFDCIHTLRLKS